MTLFGGATLVIVNPEHLSRWRRARLQRRYGLHEPRWADTAFGRIAKGLYWEALIQYDRERRLKGACTNLHYLIGGLSVVLAATAGFSGLAEFLDAKTVAFISLASAVTGALATFLNADSLRTKHERLAAGWDSLRDEVTVLWESRPDAETGRDPAGWRECVDVVRRRASTLRAGQHDDIALEPIVWSL